MAQIIRIESGLNTISVYLDDGKSLRVRKKDIALPEIHIGTEIDYETLVGKVCKAQLDEGYEAALCLLDFCARTEKTLRDKLRVKGYLEPVLDAVTERLKRARLIDDSMIAQNLVSTMTASGKGKYAIKQKLRLKGIGEEDAEAALTEVSEESQTEGATAEARKLMRKYTDLEPRQAKQKLSQALARRGYGWDSIEIAISRVLNSDED